MSLKADRNKTSSQNELINFDDVKKAALILRALNNPLRKNIIAFLLKTETASVTNIVLNLGEEQTVISQHLNILRKAKIVMFLKKGKNVYYFLNKSWIAEIQNCLSKLFEENSFGDRLKKIVKSS